MFDNNDTIRNKQKTGNNAKEEKRNNDKTTAKAAAAAILGAALGVGGANAVQAATTEEPEAQPEPKQTQPQPEAKLIDSHCPGQCHLFQWQMVAAF